MFLKPEQARVRPPGPIRLPPGAKEVHHEAEVVVRVGPGGTRRGRRAGPRPHRPRAAGGGEEGRASRGRRRRASAPARASGRSWPSRSLPPLDRLRFTLTVNGAVRQRGDTAAMLRPVPRILAEIDRWFGLRAGDLVYTGTPEGVGPIAPGDVLELALEGVPAAAARFVVERRPEGSRVSPFVDAASSSRRPPRPRRRR